MGSKQGGVERAPSLFVGELNDRAAFDGIDFSNISVD
jgi:hypothetical protein